MNHKVLQDSISMENEEKYILVAISSGNDVDYLKKHSPDRSTKKHSRAEE